MAAQLPPYNFPSSLQEECVNLLNHLAKQTVPEYHIRYRYDASGNIVPLSASQERFFGDPGDIEISAKEARHTEIPTTPYPPPKPYSYKEHRWELIQQNTAYIKAQEEYSEQIMTAWKPLAGPIRRTPEGVKEYFATAKRLRESIGKVPDKLMWELKVMWVKSANAGYSDNLFDQKVRVASKMNSRNRIEKMDAEVKYAELVAKTKEHLIHVNHRIRNDPTPSIEEMEEAVLEVVKALRLKPSEEWEELYNGVIQSIADAKAWITYLQDAPPTEEELKQERDTALPPQTYITQNISWADEAEAIIIKDRSREMTQLARRVAQSHDGTALVYFGVTDDGDLVKLNQRFAVQKFFTKFLYELIDEKVYTYEINFLTDIDFRKKQLAFPSYKEVETGNIEYKSTGSHKEGPSADAAFEVEKDWRVIELIVKRSLSARMKQPDKDRIIKRIVWGYPPLTLSDQVVRTPSTIAAISRYREPCYRQDGWDKLTDTQKKKKRAEDRFQVASYEALGQTLQSITTGLILARQVNLTKKGLRNLDFSKQKDRDLYFLINNIQKEVILLWETVGWDKTNDQIKQIAARLRVHWQLGRSTLNQCPKLESLIIKYIEELEPIHNNALIILTIDEIEHRLTSYGLCVLGTLNRALPPPSFERTQEETWNTYERFQTPFSIGALKMFEVQMWASNFFKEMTEPSKLMLTPVGSSSCLERSRADGGIGSLISDLYQVIKGIQNLDHLPNTKLWREEWINCPPLLPGNIQLLQRKNNEFAYAISLDICTPYLEHTKVCPGKTCKELYKHFALLPIGIAERGHKVRVPCLGSGFFNILQQPIRKALFGVIRRDNRCSYRTTGGEKREKLQKFLETFEKSDLIHSGDLAVSTDNFSHEFNLALCEGINNTGKITPTEYLILKAAVGGFRMMEPSMETDENLKHCKPDRLYTRAKEEIVLLPPLTLKQQMLLKVRNWDEIPTSSKYATKATLNVKPTRPKPCCVKCQKTSGPCTVIEKIPNVDPDKGIDEKFSSITYPKHTFVKVEKSLLSGFCKESGMRNAFNEKSNLFHDQSRKGLGSPTEQQFGNIDFDVTLAYYLKKIKDCNSLEAECYLTKRGVQMSQAVSIATLYSFNLFADDKSRKAHNSQGKSQLCGDDSLRAGNHVYVHTYRSEIEILGGVWSKTKDIVGNNGNGIFTEQHFTEGRVMDIPKLKAASRFDVDNIPGWLKAIQSVNKIEFPKDANPLISSQGREEVLYPFRDQLEYLSQIIPIGISKTLGGLGSKDYPLHWTIENILKSIQAVDDKQIAVSMLKRITRCLHPRVETQTRQRKINIHIDYPKEETTTFMKKLGYLKGTHRWIYLEDQALRSAMEGVVALEDPPLPVKFPLGNDQSVMLSHIQDLSEVRDELYDLGLYPPTQDNLDVDNLILNSYHFDVPRSIVKDIIGTVDVKKIPYGIFP